MACQTITTPHGSAIACGPRRRRAPCKVPGCNQECLYLCDFPLAGAKAGKTCSRRMWEPLHDVDLCTAHVKVDVIMVGVPNKDVAPLP